MRQIAAAPVASEREQQRLQRLLERAASDLAGVQEHSNRQLQRIENDKQYLVNRTDVKLQQKEGQATEHRARYMTVGSSGVLVCPISYLMGACMCTINEMHSM